MRRFYAVVAFCALAAHAQAEEVRVVPAAGSTLTFRTVTTTKTPERTISTGQIYVYVVASSDGMVAEGSIKLIALLFDCRGHEQEADCVRIKAAPDAREENGLTAVPIPAAAADKLAAQSAFKVRAFIVERRKFPLPLPDFGGARPDGEFLDTADPMILTNAMLCDPAALAAFTPLGKAPQATLSCQTSFERSGGSASGMKPISSAGSFSLDVSYQGEGRVALPSGEWEVRDLSIMQTSSSTPSTKAHSEIQFSDKLGAAVKTHFVVEASSGKVVTETESELIAVSP